MYKNATYLTKPFRMTKLKIGNDDHNITNIRNESPTRKLNLCLDLMLVKLKVMGCIVCTSQK
jgi:hypothetical protein